MSLKNLMKQGAKALQDPRVMKVMQDPRVMKAFAKGFELKGKVQQQFDERVESLAGSLHGAS
jgi:hypothetical protein